MLLKNSKGKEKEFEILFEVEQKNKKYVVYQDIYNNNVYCGKYEKDKLKTLTEKEFLYIKNLINEIEG